MRHPRAVRAQLRQQELLGGFVAGRVYGADGRRGGQVGGEARVQPAGPARRDKGGQHTRDVASRGGGIGLNEHLCGSQRGALSAFHCHASPAYKLARCVLSLKCVSQDTRRQAQWRVGQTLIVSTGCRHRETITPATAPAVALCAPLLRPPTPPLAAAAAFASLAVVLTRLLLLLLRVPASPPCVRRAGPWVRAAATFEP